MNPLLQHLIHQLQEIQTGRLWMGANYSQMLKGITDQNAFVRPIPSLHSVAEIISHLTAWRNETILKIKTGKGKMMDSDAENWLPNEVLKPQGWQSILQAYQYSLEELLVLLQKKDDAFLEQIYFDTDYKGDFPYAFVIHGMLHHDLYHLGQLGIIIKYLKEENMY